MSVTITGARRQSGTGVAGRLNDEWDRLCADGRSAAVARWAAAHPALAGCRELGDIEATVTAAGSVATTAAGSATATAAAATIGRPGADAVLLALLRLAHDGDALAGRTVLQLMLGKAIRIAGGHAGRDSRDSLEHAAVAALWTVIATYPTERRPTKVAANIAMDTLGVVSRELAHRRAETPTEPDTLAALLGCAPGTGPGGGASDGDLAELLAWAVDAGVVTAADAGLLLDIYAPAPGLAGGSAAADRAGISWPAARQRASRAVRRIALAVRADAFADAVGATLGDDRAAA
ncbi:hypothetical protein E1212_06740 [Jiangella ureilytica]|uniref:Sigma-70 family RNA polymerase sigma factor n=1 Tax=Jiangella ureilytica TaxID=2530374 RepID=A0A4R4RSU1_9ACTN|nr:hypothetical protein [Jiangella ureilytica]TDC53111.1 hypothetical protein E1212_06740 [Jiangella ureilytica]